MRRLVTVLLAVLVAVSGPALVVGAAGTTAVTLSPESPTSDVGETTTFDVVVEAADGGVGNYSFDVALETGSVGSISNVSLAGDPADSNVTYGPDDDSVNVSASGADTADIGSVTVATVTVTADASGTSAVALAVTSLTDEAGNDYDVSSADEATLSVGSPAFAVSDLSAPANATQGDVVTVNATVENTGSVAGTEDVQFRFDLDGDGTLSENETLATQSVELNASENTTVSFDVPTDGVAPGTYRHGVFAGDSNQTASIDIEPRPATAFAVSDLSAPANVTQGDVVTVNATVENNGSAAGTEDVQFRFDLNGDGNLTENETLANQSVELNASENTTVSFDVPTDGVAPGTYRHGVFAGDSNQTASITVESADGPAFAVSDLDAPANVTQGDVVTVNATVENTGSAAGTEDVQFRFDLDGDGTLSENETLATQSVELNASENTTVSFDVPTDGVAPGTYLHGVFAADSNQTASITVESATAPAFAVSDLSAPANATQGDVITVSATVTGDENASGSTTVDFRVDLDGDGNLSENETLASQSVSLDQRDDVRVAFGVDTTPLAPGSYTHGIVTDSDNETATLNVSSPPPAFSVPTLQAPATATVGENVTVTATVSNDGDEAATQDVQFRLDQNGDGSLSENETLANQTVSLDPGETTTVSFDVPTAGLEPGSYTHGVATADDVRPVTLVVEGIPAEFEVSNLSAPENVTRLQNVTVSATVTNVGDGPVTDTVDFRVDLDGDGNLTANETVANQSVELDAGENATVSFEVPTAGLSPGTYTHGVFTAIGGETASIVVEPAPATFRVSNLTAPPNATRGDVVTVNATVTNVGDEAGNATVDFRADFDGDGNLSENETVANQSVELDAGENATVSFDVPTAGLEPGTYTHGVFVDGDRQTATITLEPRPAVVTVGNLTAPANVTQGDPLTVNATVTNDGDLATTSDVQFRFDFDGDGELGDDETVANQSVELDGGENATVSFDVPTEELPPGTFTHGVVTANDSATATIDVAAASEGPNLAVVGLDAPASVVRGETATVNATLRNVGTESATQDVQFRLDLDGDGSLSDNETVLNQSVTVASAETRTVSFAVPTEDVASGSYTHGVFTANDSATATIAVEPQPANFSVSNLSAPANATRGDGITVNATVTNVGELAGNASVDFRVDLDGDGNLTPSETLATQTVELDAGENATVSFDVPTGDLPPGSYTHGVFTANDSATATIDIEPRPANLVVSSLDAPATAPRGETIEVAAELSNLGDETGDATAAFRVDLDGDGNLSANETLLEESVSIEGGQNVSVAFDVPTGDLAPGTYTHGVFIDGANQTAELEVMPRPTGTYLDVWNVSSPTSATQGENVTVTASVANIGNETGEDVVELQLETADGIDVLDQQTLNLTANESQTVTFSAAIPENATPGEGTFAVSSANDSATGAVTIEEAPTEYDRDAIADAIYGTNVSDLNVRQAGVVEELYLRQPFATDLEAVQARDDIAQERYGMAFDALNRSATIEVQDAFDAQFGDTGENVTYDRSEIATAKYGFDFDDLSAETAGQVAELFNRQPFADGLEPAQVLTREELARAEHDVGTMDDLTREQRLHVERLYDAQFAV